MTDASARPSRRRWRLRLGLVLASTLGTLALAEVVARLAFRDTVQSLLASRAGVGEGARRVLCLGDSYTFGLYYRAEESYPGRLQEMLRAAEGPASWGVVNAGVPAQNTAQILAALPDLLATWKPEVVLFLAGHNNRWNLANPRRQGALRRAWESLVLVRLVRLALAPPAGTTVRERITDWSAQEVGVTVPGQAVQIDVEKTQDRRTDEELIQSVSADLELLVPRCQEAGAQVWLLTYPSPEVGYEAPARAARQVAERTGAGLVDLRATFAGLLERRPYHELLIPGDRHPTERGHYWMARAVMEALAAQGVVASLPDLDALPEARYEAGLARAAAGGLALRGPPGAEFQILLATDAGPGQPVGARTLPLAADDCFQASQEAAALKGRLDPEGRAEVALPPDLAETARFAALVVYHDWKLPAPDLMVRQIVGPLALD